MTALLSPLESAPVLIDVNAPPFHTPPSELSPQELWLLEHTTIEDTFAPSDPDTIHTIQTIELPDGMTHRRLVSEPLHPANDPPYDILTLLGWTESIDSEYVEKYQTNLSRLHPGIRVITQATHGLDGTADDLSPWEKLGLGLDDLAQHTYDAWKFLYADRPLIVVPTSFNASVYARVQQLNAAEGNPVQVIDQILDEPYLLTCDEEGGRVGRAVNFLRHIMKDSVMELLTRNPITEVPGIVKDYLGSFPHKADLPAVGGQGLSLLQCTKKEVIAAMLARGAYIIQGSEDCLVRDDINSLPGAELKVVPGKGHSKGANYRNRVRDVSDAIHLRAGLHAATLAIASL